MVYLSWKNCLEVVNDYAFIVTLVKNLLLYAKKEMCLMIMKKKIKAPNEKKRR